MNSVALQQQAWSYFLPNHRRSTKLFGGALLALALLSLSLPVQANANTQPLFESAEPLQLELLVDTRAVRRLKPDEEIPGQLVLTTKTGEQTFSVNVSPRGKSRLRECKFPPLWLNFKKSEVADTLFDNQNKVKLVTHCTRSFAKQGFIAAELLVYQLQNIIEPESLRTRAASMVYRYNKSEDTQPVFFIEHKKRFAAENNLQIIDNQRPAIESLHPAKAARAALFQYMVGNTDFSFVQGPAADDCCHNVVPMQAPGTNHIIPILYDFDATGLVNVPYVTPNPDIGITQLTQRRYRGYCDHNSALETARSEFLAKESQIMAAVENFQSLPGLKTKRISKYLTRFFDTLRNDRSFTSKLVKKCR